MCVQELGISRVMMGSKETRYAGRMWLIVDSSYTHAHVPTYTWQSITFREPCVLPDLPTPNSCHPYSGQAIKLQNLTPHYTPQLPDGAIDDYVLLLPPFGEVGKDDVSVLHTHTREIVAQLIGAGSSEGWFRIHSTILATNRALLTTTRGR